MNLGEVRLISTKITLICKNCGYQQPVGSQRMINKFGPETELEEALKREACMSCEELGVLKAFVPLSD